MLGYGTVKPRELIVQASLGRGAQAQVYKAKWVREFVGSTSSITVAVKCLDPSLGALYRDREALLVQGTHRNLVECFDFTDTPPYLIVSEYCAGGSLFDLIHNSQVELHPDQTIKILADVASGMRYLHGKQPPILHRDLKSSNVLLARPIKSSTQTPLAKVCDFGLARHASDDGNVMTVAVGTWRWMAPEVFSDTQYDSRVDVFAFGMLIYEMSCRKLPYAEAFPDEAIDPRLALHVWRGFRPELPAEWHLPQALLDMMQRAWQTDPDQRPHFTELVPALLEMLSEAPSDRDEES